MVSTQPARQRQPAAALCSPWDSLSILRRCCCTRYVFFPHGTTIKNHFQTRGIDSIISPKNKFQEPSSGSRFPVSTYAVNNFSPPRRANQDPNIWSDTAAIPTDQLLSNQESLAWKAWTSLSHLSKNPVVKKQSLCKHASSSDLS